ncbi:hypothetical protein HPB48_012273 [Haemaphysalis longicornis]|uniref:Uncharacterized protein n=1 Tax=Haemaphysalis longicornis TaxID=44386 RepID=A0A9J6GS69_HAELO|nr:hypothetical protein HPB48_012273 [Haemaphysalis longicornis]
MTRITKKRTAYSSGRDYTKVRTQRTAYSFMSPVIRSVRALAVEENAALVGARSTPPDAGVVERRMVPVTVTNAVSSVKPRRTFTEPFLPAEAGGGRNTSVRSRNRIRTERVVDALRKAELKLVTSDKEGGFAVLPSREYNRRTREAIESNFRKDEERRPEKIKKTAISLCEDVGLEKLAKSIKGSRDATAVLALNLTKAFYKVTREVILIGLEHIVPGALVYNYTRAFSQNDSDVTTVKFHTAQYTASIASWSQAINIFPTLFKLAVAYLPKRGTASTDDTREKVITMSASGCQFLLVCRLGCDILFFLIMQQLA